MIQIFLQSMFIGYTGAIMPGSLLTYTLDKSMKNGVKAGFMVSIGHSLLEFMLVILLFTGFGKYIDTPLARFIIGILGGIVLLFFGFSMVRDVYKGRVSVDWGKSTDARYGNIIAGGALISAANPYFLIWWVVIGFGLIMNAYTTFGIAGIALFYLGHIMADFTWYIFVSALISKTRGFINLKIYKSIIVFLGICLAGFGLSFIIRAFL